jgi:hypothetical protein
MRRCTYNGKEIECSPRKFSPKIEQHFLLAGSSLWKELHLWALTKEPDIDWLISWEKKVKAALGICTCYKHWLKLKEQYPVDWDNLFEWTVRVHNIVNRKLGKPQMTVAEARELYS